jgi:hypothetical protein
MPLQLFSHKILRRLVVVPLLLVFITSLVLAPSSPLYALAAAAADQPFTWRLPWVISCAARCLWRPNLSGVKAVKVLPRAC